MLSSSNARMRNIFRRFDGNSTPELPGMENVGRTSEVSESGLFAEGRVRTFDWALEAELVGSKGNQVYVRKLACPRLYETPQDTWQGVWYRAGEWLGKHGEYESPTSQLEVWADRSGGRSIEASTTVECWPKLARDLRTGPRILTGIVAVRNSGAGSYGCPGLTIAIETPSGGATGALMLIERLGQRGIGGCLATQENNGRWGIVRLIFPPFWYAAGEERLFGVDWVRWASSDGDQNEGKRIWCEHAAVAVAEVLQEL